MASGKAAVIASGKPFSPSTTAIRTSWTPRFFNSFITEIQNLAPSFPAIYQPVGECVHSPQGYRPRTLRKPSRLTPRAT